MKDSMFPKKPEDFETAIQQMPKFLKKELEEMIGDKPIDITVAGDNDNNNLMPWLEKNRELQKTNTLPKTVKCTCPIQIHTKKRDKKKQLIVMRKQTNGFYVYCPIHSKL